MENEPCAAAKRRFCKNNHGIRKGDCFMKRKMLLFVSLFLCSALLFSACQTNTPAADGEGGATTEPPAEEQTIPGLVVDAPLPEQTAIGNLQIGAAKTLNLAAIEPFFDETDAANYEAEGGFYPNKPFDDDIIFGWYATGANREEWIHKQRWGIYHLSDGSLQDLGEVGTMLNYTSDSVIMHGDTYYCVWSVSDDSDTENTASYTDNTTLYKISARNQTVTKSDALRGAALALWKLDEDHFLYTVSEGDETQGSVTVYQYDCNTDTASALLTESWQPDGASAPMSFATMSVADGKLYLFFSNETDNHYTHLLRIYNADGTKEQEIALPVLAEIAPIKAIGAVHVLGDYLYCSMDGFDAVLLRLTEDGAELVTNFDEALDLWENQILTVQSSAYSTAQCPYLALQVVNREHIKEGVSFYLLSAETGQLTLFTVETDNAYAYLGDLMMDENGNLILRMTGGPTGTADIFYRIDRADLLPNLA